MGFEEEVVVSYLVGVEGSEGVGGLGLAWHPLWPAGSQPNPLYPRVAGCAPLAVGIQHHSHSSEGPLRSQIVEGELLPSSPEQKPSQLLVPLQHGLARDGSQLLDPLHQI